MKKTLIILLVFSFLQPLAFAQIKFPNLLGGIKQSFTKPKSVSWNCPLPEGNGVEVLPVEKELKITARDNGDVKISPNIFGKRIFSKNFWQRTFNKITKKDNMRHIYDYKGCLEDLYNKVGETFDQDVAARLKQTIAKSDYFKPDENKIIVPLYSDRPELLISEKEVNEALDHFCANQNSPISDVLKSTKVASLILGQSRSYQNDPRYSYNCLRNLNEKLSLDQESYLSEVCNIASQTVCSSFKSDLEAQRLSLAQAVDQYEKNVLDIEARRFKNFVREEVHNEFKNTISKKDLTCEELKKVSFYHVNHIDYDVMMNENIENIANMKGDNQCLSQIMQNYLTSRQNYIRNDSGYEKFCEKNLTPKCIENRKARAVIVDNYKALFTKLYGTRGERHFEQDIACRIDEENPLEGLLKSLDDNKSVLHCLDVKPGEFKVVRTHDNYDAHTGNYTLKRIDEKNYDVILNLNFTSTSGASVTPEEMRERVNNCVGDVNQFLKGPSGEQLNLKILDTNNIQGISPLEVPSPTAINIEKSGFRSHSRAYEETISCAVITHELLHLFGLCDEYEEKWNPAAHNYACRVVPKTASIMKDHDEAFEKGVGRINNCECVTESCKKIMGSQNAEFQDIFLQASVYNLTDSHFRTEYCQRPVYGKKANFEDLDEADRQGLKIEEQSEGFLKIKSLYTTETYPQLTSEFISCQCPKDDESCLGKMENVKAAVENSRGQYTNYCPNGSRQLDSKIGTLPQGKPSSLENNRFSFAKKPEWDSLLHPAHAQRILGGSCDTEGADYLQCMIYAYERKPKSDCKVPEKCKEDSFYLGIKK